MKVPWKYYDYCHNPYLPIASTKGKFSPNALLNNSLLESSFSEQFILFIKVIIKAIGPWNTVWGVKLNRGVLTWELYFYNHQSKDSLKKVTSLLKVFSACFKVPDFRKINLERMPYFMWSVDIDQNILKSRQMQGLHIYIPGRSDACQGNSYFCNDTGFVLENHYDFFRLPRETYKFIDRVKHSIVLGSESSLFMKNDLVKRLMLCHEICFANKRTQEGVYFSRINVDQLIYFLEWFAYPSFIVDFIKANKHRLNHLLYDVAFDCTIVSGKIKFGKSSYYGVF